MNWRFAFILIVFLSACGKKERNQVLDNNILNDCNLAIQNAIIVDNVGPPVGARRYYYACVAAYESLVPFNPEYKTLAGQLHEFTTCPLPDTSVSYCLDLVAMSAHTFVSQKLVYKEDSITGFRDRKLKWYKSQLSSAQYKASIKYGETVGTHIVKWASTDTFDQIRGRDFYTHSSENGKWQPTSPEFTKAMEPNWRFVRPAFIPHAGAFPIKDPEPFSSDKKSRFYTITKEVYVEVQKKDSNHLATCRYWDDGPNTTVHIGHFTYNVLKVSPAGHWLSIFRNIARQKSMNLMQTAEGFARFSAVIHDAFIACWDTKYKTDYIRPETAIRLLIDSSFVSPIQTPPFPEYPSGHTVVSTAVATFATAYFADAVKNNYVKGQNPGTSFIDSTEMEFGFGTRKYNSILDAANEACISRLYGGIHFMDAIENGKSMGVGIGNYHFNNLKTR